MDIPRRQYLTFLSALGLGSFALAQPESPHITPVPASTPPPQSMTPQQLGFDPPTGLYTLPALPYDKAALEPHIDAQTMELHHDKHHAAYVAGANKALKELTAIREGGDPALVKHWSRELSFHASGHINHTLFWNMLAPANKGGGGSPSGKLAEAITASFGSFEKFLTHFKAAATQVEGGGWAWLVYDPHSRRLLVIQEEKQQDLMLTGCRPILGVDVWEHAYYLKYQNRRADYINAVLNVVNWGFAGMLFEQASR